MSTAATHDPDRPSLRLIHPAPTREQRQIIPNAVLGTLLFVGSEVMLFAGLISAFAIVKTNAPGGIWPPPGQPRLPVLATGLNSLFLLASGALLFYAWRRFKDSPESARMPFLASIVSGSIFVVVQGMEWFALLRQGLTMQSGNHGSFFTLIVGLHAIHAVAALTVMFVLYRKLTRSELDGETLSAMQVFWYFVVGIWPILYVQVYL